MNRTLSWVLVLALGLAPSGIAAAEAPADESSLRPELVALGQKVRRTLRAVYARRLNTRDHGPWEIMHSAIAEGVGAKVLAGGPSGDPVTAIGWLCFNRAAYGQRLFYLSGDRLALRMGPGLQGHEGQLLAVLAQSRVKRDYPIRVSGRDFTVADLVEYEKATCASGTELTFKLIGLVHYLPSDAVWQNDLGGRWTIERMIHEELDQPIRGATCGGSHRLMGLSYAVGKRGQRGEPMTGEFARAQKYIHDYHQFAFKFQNADGSFSTEWFGRRASDQDDALRLETTGHVLEWLVYSLPADALEQPRVVKAVDYLADLLIRMRGRNVDMGVLGHAVRSLMVYQRRVFGDGVDAAVAQMSVENQASQ